MWRTYAFNLEMASAFILIIRLARLAAVAASYFQHKCVDKCLNGIFNAAEPSLSNDNTKTETHCLFCRLPIVGNKWKQINGNCLVTIRMAYAKICCESHKLNYFNWFLSTFRSRCFRCWRHSAETPCAMAEEIEETARDAPRTKREK